MDTRYPHPIVEVPEGQDAPPGFKELPSNQVGAVSAMSPRHRAHWLRENTTPDELRKLKNAAKRARRERRGR